MALTPEQMDNLLEANPFIPTDWLDYMHDQIVTRGQLSYQDAYFYLFNSVTELLKYLQYALNEDDETLEKPLMKVSGQIRPAANVITTLEDATAGKLNIVQLVTCNTGGAPDTLTIYHVKAGGVAGAGNIIDQRTLNAGADNQGLFNFNLPLSVGEKLQIETSGGFTTITSYVDG